MATIIIHDINGKVLDIIPSADTGKFLDENEQLLPNHLKNPIIPTCPQKYMKVVDGIIIEVSEEEKVVINLALEPSYAEKRASAYPKVGDQLDMIYKAMKAGEIPAVATFVEAIDLVKTTYPKPVA